MLENIFHLTKSRLLDQAVEMGLTYESRAAFKERVIRTLHEVAKEHGNNTIASMPKRLKEVVASGGARSRY